MKDQIPADLQPVPDDLQPATPSMDQHPWMQFNKASKEAPAQFGAGKEYPGGGYIPTYGEAGADVAGLGATIAATPIAAAVAPSAPVLGPMIGRTLAGGVPGLLQGDLNKAGMGIAGSGSTEILASVLGLPGFANRAIRTPAVHQAANQPVAGAPIIVNRPGGGQITVPPPSSGVWHNGPNHPAVIVQDRFGRNITPTFGTVPRTIADTMGRDNPEEAMTGALGAGAALNALRKLLPIIGGGHIMGGPPTP